MKYIDRFRHLLQHVMKPFSKLTIWLWPHRPIIEQPIIKSIEEELPIIIAKKPRAKSEPNLRNSVLNDLDIYFKALKRMKKSDPESFKLYAQVGMHLISSIPDTKEKILSKSRIEPWWLKVRPAFGAFALDNNATEKWKAKDHQIYPKLIYFNKYKRKAAPTILQPSSSGTDVYTITVYFDELESKGFTEFKTGLPLQYGVSVDRDGNIKLLKMLKQPKTIKYTDGTTARGVGHSKWEVPEFYKDWTKEHNEGHHENLSVYDFLEELFIVATNLWAESQNSTAMVRATRGNLTACFGINPRKTARFFDDRDIETNTKKKIFHGVKPHMRATKTGETAVRLHFRGEKRFTWNGYDIQITVPGKDHFHWNEFDGASQIVDENVFDKKQFIGMTELGEIIKKNTWGGVDVRNLVKEKRNH